jgi:hypothetical protein
VEETELGIVTLLFTLFLVVNYVFFTEILNPVFLVGMIMYFVFFELMGLKKVKKSYAELLLFAVLLMYWVVSFPFYVIIETIWGWLIFICYPTLTYITFYRREKKLYLALIVLTLLFSVAHLVVLGQTYANFHLFFIPIVMFLILTLLYYYFSPRKVKKKRKKK